MVSGIFNLADGTSQTILSNDENQYQYLLWSPDDKGLLFFQFHDNGITGNLYLYNLEEDAVTELLPGERIPVTELSWSPDGKKLLYEFSRLASKHGIPSGLFLYDFTTREIRQIQKGGIDGRIFSYQARWSPDSQYVEYIISYK